MTEELLKQLIEEQRRTADEQRRVAEEQRRTGDLIASLVDEMRKARRSGRKRSETVAQNAARAARKNQSEKVHRPNDLQIASAKRARIDAAKRDLRRRLK